MMGGPGVMPPTMAYGLFGANMEYGLAARRAMYEFNTGPDTWAEIAMSQRKWANLNPRASSSALSRNGASSLDRQTSARSLSRSVEAPHA